ncbi:MAG: replication initiation protein [Thioalkalivibrio sp.]|nr:replication initiation protein [Thioalkalivibrio sp.]
MVAARKYPEQENQLDLFDAQRWPRRPNCKPEKDARPLIRTLAHARRYPYIQPNAPTVLFRLAFDIDRRGAILAWDDAEVAPPNWIAVNPANGHAHAVYELEVPVAMVNGDRPDTKPMRFAASLESAFRIALDADPSYAGHYVKNPGHRRWDTTLYRHEPYDLWELAEWVDLPRKQDLRRKPDMDAVAGRNCYLFERLSRWSYRAVRDYWRPGGYDDFRAAVEAYAEAINAEIEVQYPGRGPLAFPEMRHTVKSVANWTWSHMTPAGFREWASRRGRRGGKASKGGGRPRQYANAAEKQRAYRERLKTRGE